MKNIEFSLKLHYIRNNILKKDHENDWHFPGYDSYTKICVCHNISFELKYTTV